MNSSKTYTPDVNKATMTGDQVTKLIATLRSLLNPTPVKQGVFPCRGRRDPHPHNTTGWLDHYGTTDYYGQRLFVSEPYDLSLEKVTEATQFAESINCRLQISGVSWWFPGYTVRLLFIPKETNNGKRF